MYEILSNNLIEVRTANVYGNDMMYVCSEHAKWIQDLTGRKTLSSKDIQALQNLGFEFKFN